ncbi:UDPglucose--hexose-1-phosphate uridylyltransferase [Microbacterium resistens]|uniref:Galactose-1-phosphate uridylyltransferase n=1 Tax=Microbacterium resistens TaxID=156977 RepID=A0ABU1SC12_9MICO|nr:galactose-1-phosphate uridylyltransferase [Microbacterium resistens]MDR6867152.1 UDPglucose--hexose-1-phosphate uridylyltransferase [Microbacterium resistens]
MNMDDSAAQDPQDIAPQDAALSTVAGPSEAVTLGAGVIRRSSRLADGRELLYYDDPDTALPAARAIDARALAPRPDTASMRQDVLTGDWITFASARQNRVLMPSADADPLAPQTPTNPSEVPSMYDVAVFENRSPSFGPALGAAPDPNIAPVIGDLIGDGAEASVQQDSLALGRIRPSIGRCEVVCFSPEATGSFGTQTVTRARTVIEAWADRTAALSALPGIEQVFPFENRGEAIGVSLPHPHGQIYAYPYITPRTTRLLESIDRSSADLLARVLAFERSSSRVVLQGEHWTAFVPFAARWPLEVQLMPHRHAPDFAALTGAERDELAPLYLRLLRGVDAMYDSPTPYIAAWHQAPVNRGRDTVRMRLELTSPRRAADKLKFLAGSESAMSAWTAEILPEAAAERLREAIASLPS